jgi:biotin carboxyl carrier protein
MVSSSPSPTRRLSSGFSKATIRGSLQRSPGERILNRARSCRLEKGTLAKGGRSWSETNTDTRATRRARSTSSLPHPSRAACTAAAAGATAITAPLAGTIAAVSVAEGDEVAEGQLLLVLEAMKMEHRITAPSAGVVKAVHVRETGRGARRRHAPRTRVRRWTLSGSTSRQALEPEGRCRPVARPASKGRRSGPCSSPPLPGRPCPRPDLCLWSRR